MSNINCWKYSREIYLIGRGIKHRFVNIANGSDEKIANKRAAICKFIGDIMKERPSYNDYVNNCAGNPPVIEIAKDGQVVAITYSLDFQNVETLGKMIQRIGRSLKVQFCSEKEKEICDEFIAAYHSEGTEEAEEGTETEQNNPEEGGGGDSGQEESNT